MERDRIGLNIGSMLPWSAVPIVGLTLAAWMTRTAGYAFWQVLPLRSVTVEGLRQVGIPVRFVEPAWNPTTFWSHLRGEPGAEGMPTMLQDPLFFPDPVTCDARFRQILVATGATPIYHKLRMAYGSGLVEVHPGLGFSVQKLVKIALGLKPYVIDLRHLRRESDNGLSFGPWHEALAALLPFAGLIHIQAYNSREWQRFLAGKPSTLGGMLRFVRTWGYTGSFVVEFDPRAMGLTGLLPWRLAENLRRVRERVEELTL